MSEDAVELEALLGRRAAALARPLPSRLREPQRALCLALGSDRVLMPMAAALAITPLTQLTPVPFAEPHVAGLTSRRGAVLPVFQLRVLLGLPLSQLPETSRIVILAAPGEPALAVDAVTEEELPEPGVLQPPPVPLAGAPSGWIRGASRDGRLVLDVESLLASPLLTIDVGPRVSRR